MNFKMTSDACGVGSTLRTDRESKASPIYLVRSKAVDLLFDGEQDIDARDRLGRDRRLGEPCKMKKRAPAVRPARGLEDRAAPAIGLVEPAKAGVSVGLHQSGIARQMLLRMRTATIGRVEEHGRRRIWAGKRTVVAHVMRWTG